MQKRLLKELWCRHEGHEVGYFSNALPQAERPSGPGLKELSPSARVLSKEGSRNRFGTIAGLQRKMTSRRSPAISPKYHDFIELTFPVREVLFAKLAPLYVQGLSLLEISDQTGIPKTTIRNELIRGGISLRPLRSETLAEGWRKRMGKLNTKPPYGFCYLQGELTKYPKEYPVLNVIHSRWKSGMALNSIATLLNGKRIPSPMNKDWSWNSINNIVERFKNKKVIIRGGKLELR